jgi:hypothetical protein
MENSALLGELGRVLELVLNPADDTDQFAIRWTSEFIAAHPQMAWGSLLLDYFGDLSNPEGCRSVAAILLYALLYKGSADLQREYATVYLEVDAASRDRIRRAAVVNMSSSQTASHLIQVANLLGVIFSLELSQPNEPLLAEFARVIDMAASATPTVKFAVFQMIEFFAIHSLEIREEHEQRFPARLFPVLLSGVADFSDPRGQRKALSAMSWSLSLFKRSFSFPHAADKLVSLVARILREAAPGFLWPAYSVLRRCFDYFYPYMEAQFALVGDIVFADLSSGIDVRQVEACLFWLTVGEVESDIIAEDKRSVPRRHRDFDHCFGFASRHFSQLCSVLIDLVMDTTSTAANIALDYTPAHAAFACLASLARAVDETALSPIIDFVSANGDSPEWRRRYTSILLLSAAARTKSRVFAFDFFVKAVGDVIPRISEVAMWSLGRLVEHAPELVADEDRFGALFRRVSEKFDVSVELTSRGCWLLHVCFGAFESDDSNSPLVNHFDELADVLLAAAETDAQEAALGALSKLIERTPETLTAEYLRLLGKLIERLPMQAILGLVQAIVLNVGSLIEPQAGDLIAMLIPAVQTTSEVLPTMGAIARAIKNEFAQYLPQLLDSVFVDFTNEEFVRPVALFVSDIVCSIENLDPELIGKFVEFLIRAFKTFETLGFEEKVAAFVALADLAGAVGPDKWLDQFLEILEKEMRLALTVDEDVNQVKMLLPVYATVVPVLKRAKNGDRKVRGFFHIFEHVLKMDGVDETVLPDLVLLIRVIADTFQRKMSVFLHKPAVIQLLRTAMEAENEQLVALAESTFEFVKGF